MKIKKYLNLILKDFESVIEDCGFELILPRGIH
jgi:hypothetical protein